MKKYLLGLSVVALAITFSAFSTTKSSKPLAGEKWFQLSAGGNANMASNYSLIGDGSTAPSCTGSNVCAKLAVPNSGNPNIPDLSTTISTKYRPTP